MQDPFIVFGLSNSASEAEIRARYLELVRLHPPEKEPERAAEIRAAYDEIRDPILRLQNQLFEFHSHQTLEFLTEANRPDLRTRRIPTEDLLLMGRS